MDNCRSWMAWFRIGPAEEVVLYVRHTKEGSLSSLWSEAHNLLEDVCQGIPADVSAVCLDDSQHDVAVSGVSFFDSSKSHFIVARVAGFLRAVGIGSNIKSRTRAAKFALAISIAARLGHNFNKKPIANRIVEQA